MSLQMALGIALPIWIIRRDMRRLPPARLARAWNDATIWSAVVAFGPVALVVYFAKTRRSVLGFVLGVGWAVLSVVPLTALAFAFSPWIDP